MYLTKIKLFSATSVNFGFILNVTILIIQTTGIFKTATNPGMMQHNFSFQLLKVTKTSSLVVRTDNNNTHWIYHNSSLSLKPSNLELLVNQFNNATLENSNDSEKVCSSKYYDIEEMHNINKNLNLNNYSFEFTLLRLLRVVPFFTLLIIYHTNAAVI